MAAISDRLVYVGLEQSLRSYHNNRAAADPYGVANNHALEAFLLLPIRELRKAIMTTAPKPTITLATVEAYASR